MGTILALKFFDFQPLDPAEQLQAFAILAEVLEEARTHGNDERLDNSRFYWWTGRGPIGVIVATYDTKLLEWGHVVVTIIAVLNFLAQNGCTTDVFIDEDFSEHPYGYLWLGFEEPTVSTS